MTPSKELEAARIKAINESRGCFFMTGMEYELRSLMGNTNYACLRDSLEEVRRLEALEKDDD